MRKILDIGEETDRHLIFETEPQPRTVKIKHCESGCYEMTTAHLSMPFVQYYLRYADGPNRPAGLYVTFSTDPFKIDRKTYSTFLPNADSIAGICMNPGWKRTPYDYITDYWASAFCIFACHGHQKDMMLHDEHWLDKVNGIDSVRSWEENTKRNPYYIMETDWNQVLDEVNVPANWALYNHIIRPWIREQRAEK